MFFCSLGGDLAALLRFSVCVDEAAVVVVEVVGARVLREQVQTRATDRSQGLMRDQRAFLPQAGCPARSQGGGSPTRSARAPARAHHRLFPSSAHRPHRPRSPDALRANRHHAPAGARRKRLLREVAEECAKRVISDVGGAERGGKSGIAADKRRCRPLEPVAKCREVTTMRLQQAGLRGKRWEGMAEGEHTHTPRGDAARPARPRHKHAPTHKRPPDESRNAQWPMRIYRIAFTPAQHLFYLQR